LKEGPIHTHVVIMLLAWIGISDKGLQVLIPANQVLQRSDFERVAMALMGAADALELPPHEMTLKLAARTMARARNEKRNTDAVPDS
jgi:hypothetical protein